MHTQSLVLLTKTRRNPLGSELCALSVAIMVDPTGPSLCDCRRVGVAINLLTEQKEIRYNKLGGS